MKVLVTGGTGFLGTWTVRALESRGHVAVGVGRRRADLRKFGHAVDLLSSEAPDAVIHLAALVGGIGANMASPATFWRDNLLMGMNVLEAAKETKLKRLLLVGTTCSYPKVPSRIPFVEDDLYNGYPEETNAPYGIAKRTLLAGADAYCREHGLDIVSVIPTNLYGPGDCFDPARSHFIAAVMLKFYDAIRGNHPSVTFWGTGTATRDFLYVEDAARALAMACESLRGPQPVNLGTSREISIASLAYALRGIAGYQGNLVWDNSKPDGQPRRALDSSRATKAFGWVATTTLEEGLDTTWKWFLDRKRTEVPV